MKDIYVKVYDVILEISNQGHNMTFFTYSECLRKTPNCDDGAECGWSQRAVWASHRPAVSKPATAHKGSFSIEH